MRKGVLLVFTAFVLSSCAGDLPDALSMESAPDQWTTSGADHDNVIKSEDKEALQSWWKNFDDPVLNRIVDWSLNESPDRKIAQARIAEARGLRRAS